MGGGSYERDVPIRRVRREDVFTFQGQASDGRGAKISERREVHKDLNIKEKIRECCDSEEHPITTPIVPAMDVTRSRGEDAVTIYEKVPGLIGRLIMGGITEHPVISWAAVGDATSGDHAPIQVSQFESDMRIDEALKKIWLEEGGGGTGRESYELTAYYYARKTVLDANKRGEKGFFFFLGDEGFYPNVSKDQVKVWIGDDIPQDIPSSLIFQELQQKYHTFFIFPKKSWEDKKNDIDEEIATRVKNAGGMIEGVSIRASLLWNNRNDLDIHVICPSGEEIYYGHMHSRCGGVLDVDRNVQGETMKPVENVRWEKGKAPKGKYRVFVRNFATHGSFPCETEFRAEIEIDGKVLHFDGKTPRGKTGPESDTPIHTFDYDPKAGLVEEKDKYALYDNDLIIAQWSSVLPRENILEIEDPRACVDVMIGAIALTNGKLSLKDYIHQLGPVVDGGIIDQTPERCADVKRALTRLSKIGVKKKVDSQVFSKSGTSKKKKRSKRI